MVNDDTREQGSSATQTKPTLTYSSYLNVGDLLELQHPLSPPELGPQIQAAEHFFIIVHQSFELWFSQELIDLNCATDALEGPTPSPEAALDHLLRVIGIQRLLNQHMAMFDHLSPAMFMAFRGYLGTASGAGSFQYRKVERALGVRSSEPSRLYRGFAAAVERAGLTIDQVYEHPAAAGVLYRLAEALVDISEGFWLLTATHVRVADRAIGDRPGTGGTSGVSYLEEALKLKAFPELWDVRSRL